MVGVDIGTASIKIVEVSKWGGGKSLENYGEIKSASLYKDQEAFRTFDGGSFLLSDNFVSKAVRAILDEAKIRTKSAIFSVPDYSTFCISFEIPAMPEKDIAGAVRYHAPQYIPLPISETTLDWRVVGRVGKDKNSPFKIFLVAIPNQVVQSYQRVAQMAGLELYAIEAEILAISRSLVQEANIASGTERKTICLIDIGVQSTTISVIDGKNLIKSYSFNFAGGQLTHAVSSSLGLSRTRAEEIKNQKGLISLDQETAETLYILIDPLLIEIRKIFNEFLGAEGREIDAIYLTGGTSNLPGLREYFEETFKKEVKIPNCFSNLLYPPILEESLREMGPSFSVAMGVALGGLEA
jgi:type IV pilus assembly protein PilM